MLHAVYHLLHITTYNPKARTQPITLKMEFFRIMLKREMSTITPLFTSFPDIVNLWPLNYRIGPADVSGN